MLANSLCFLLFLAEVRAKSHLENTNKCLQAIVVVDINYVDIDNNNC